MNAFKRNSFRQKLFKCAAMITILLQAACATQFPTVGREMSGWNMPNPSRLAAKDAASLICNTDMLEKKLTPPRAKNDVQKGAEVAVLLRNQREITGRLLSVRDSTVVIATNETQPDQFEALNKNLFVIEIQDILRVRSIYNETSYKGAFLGFLIGASAGALIGYSFGDDPPAGNSDCAFGAFSFGFTAEGKALLGGILGGLAGAIVGSAVDGESDREVRHDLSSLKPLAQFPEKEPD